ncbi:unnamed protein product [Cyclocybe aegerita]|uniref:3-oxo-5-alpha-steroid 4-dehydrogenase C-terminal domain-containing protein n=1 Tax=Cyclocybe aegerita TaxID=1973307 RepID=A0A8S0WI34_CYCAE|nr:unnamed protein product [Cyclocybe aegerita]
MVSQETAMLLYHEGRKWFTIGSVLTAPVLLVINAPFGRFSPQDQSSKLLLDGIKSWIVMELVSPVMFTYTFLTSPLSATPPPVSSLSTPQVVLAACFLIHYANRALLSPLRTPSRSKSHFAVPASGTIFNVFNGSIMGAYLSSPAAGTYLATVRPIFYIGLALWAVGFVGNVYHDEILLNIRRKAKSKAKAPSGKTQGEHYSIPYGGLYSIISYPNYFCEWIEWFGFALAASPLPFTLSEIADISIPSVFSSLFNPQTYSHIIAAPGSQFFPTLSPPWIFLANEIVLMLPRAYRGHQWYQNKFGDAYPKNRKAVVPFVF